VMCGYVDSSFDGSACRYDLVNRQLDADDVVGMQSLYGTVSGDADAPLPWWSSVLLGLILVGTAMRKSWIYADSLIA